MPCSKPGSPSQTEPPMRRPVHPAYTAPQHPSAAFSVSGDSSIPLDEVPPASSSGDEAAARATS
eukprot:1289250-Pleurochrysis_carterae.AAC.1